MALELDGAPPDLGAMAMSLVISAPGSTAKYTRDDVGARSDRRRRDRDIRRAHRRRRIRSARLERRAAPRACAADEDARGVADPMAARHPVSRLARGPAAHPATQLADAFHDHRRRRNIARRSAGDRHDRPRTRWHPRTFRTSRICSRRSTNTDPASVDAALNAPGVQPNYFVPVATVPDDTRYTTIIRPKLSPVHGVLLPTQSGRGRREHFARLATRRLGRRDHRRSVEGARRAVSSR